MKILSLEIENFLAIGHSGVLNLDDQGLVLIQGINNDDSSANSNGVGKSTIPDALSWVNFGETAREISGDAVVNDVAKKNCMVREVVESGANRYMIERYRKHATYKNQTRVLVQSGHAWDDISKGTEKETQALIEQILGCSKDVFMAAIYAGQETAPDLPSMTDKQLKLLVEEAAGVDKIEAALQIARKRADANTKHLAAAELKRENAVRRLEDHEARLARIEVMRKEFEDGREGRKNGHLDLARKHLASAGEHQKLLTELPALESVRTEIAALDERLANHKRLSDIAAAARTAFSSLSRAADRAAADFQRASDTIRKTLAAIKNAPEEMKKPCGECGKPHTEAELEEFVAHLKARQAREVADARELGRKWEVAKGEVTAQQEKVTAAEAAIPDVVEISRRRAELVEVKARIERTTAEIQRCKDAARSEMEHAKRVQTEENPHDGDAEMTAGRVTGLKGEIAALDTELVELRKRAVVLEQAVKVFGPAGVRAHILDTVTPFLNSQTADYLSALSDGNISATWSTLSSTAKGELREKFNIDVTNSKGAKTFKGLSGGGEAKGATRNHAGTAGPGGDPGVEPHPAMDRGRDRRRSGQVGPRAPHGRAGTQSAREGHRPDHQSQQPDRLGRPHRRGHEGGRQVHHHRSTVVSEAAESLAKNLTDLWSRPENRPTFTVDAPSKLTEYVGGRFHKKSFIGEEPLRPFGAYVGKKGNVILKFREPGFDSSHIEMSPGEAASHLAGFKDYYNELTTKLEDLLLEEHREIARAKEEAADTAARQAANPLFGSW